MRSSPGAAPRSSSSVGRRRLSARRHGLSRRSCDVPRRRARHPARSRTIRPARSPESPLPPMPSPPPRSVRRRAARPPRRDAGRAGPPLPRPLRRAPAGAHRLRRRAPVPRRHRGAARRARAARARRVRARRRRRSPRRSASPTPSSPRTVYARVREKLRREPVEDFRIDFEDGYGNRPDAEEDGHAARAAARDGGGARGGHAAAVPRHPHQAAHRGARARAALRTLDLFLTTLLRASGGALPAELRRHAAEDHASPSRCAALADALDALERGARPRRRRAAARVMVETPQSIFAADGARRAAGARRGRRRALRRRRTSAPTTTRPRCDITAAHQHMTPPGLRLRQARDAGGARRHRRAGSPTARPTSCRWRRTAPPQGGALAGERERAENRARRPRAPGGSHYDHVRHSLEQRLLPGLGPAPGAAADALRGGLRLLPRRPRRGRRAAARTSSTRRRRRRWSATSSTTPPPARGCSTTSCARSTAARSDEARSERAHRRSRADELAQPLVRPRSPRTAGVRPAALSPCAGRPLIAPYGSAVATKIAIRLSRPNGARSTGRWCRLGSESRISSIVRQRLEHRLAHGVEGVLDRAAVVRRRRPRAAAAVTAAPAQRRSRRPARA